LTVIFLLKGIGKKQESAQRYKSVLYYIYTVNHKKVAVHIL